MNGEAIDQEGVIRELSAPLYQCKGWMKLVGVMSILGGALYALTLIGIVIAWLPIWVGILLFQSAGAIELAYQSGDRNTMARSLAKLKTYFVIMGVLTLVGIVITILAFVFGFLGAILSTLEIANA
ncbi:MAG: DUF5362 domain-containing protein [Phycisphaerales bacterium]|nr:MAG: DUF5362 domain-containing protein [Phycisphaerales bacterium]